MSNNAINQHYWDKQVQVVQPAKEADKPRREKQGFAAIYKAQTTKGERRAHILAVILFLVVVGVQAAIATGLLTGPVYLADFIGG